jgi:hypothetical protein
MNYPRSEYDYGTAAIAQMCGWTRAEPETDTSYDHLDVRLANRKRALIERSHSSRTDRTSYAWTMRWVWKRYPQHFSVMR